mgnify:CR=1 FL=1
MKIIFEIPKTEAFKFQNKTYSSEIKFIFVGINTPRARGAFLNFAICVGATNGGCRQNVELADI